MSLMTKAFKRACSRERLVAEVTRKVRPDAVVNEKPFSAPRESAQ
jgi:hypothetical protein